MTLPIELAAMLKNGRWILQLRYYYDVPTGPCRASIHSYWGSEVVAAFGRTPDLALENLTQEMIRKDAGPRARDQD